MLAHIDKTTLQIIFLCKVADGLWINIAQVIFLCNIGTGRSKQHFIGYFPAKACLCTLGQHCTSNFLVQCCLRRIWRTLTSWLDNIPVQVPEWSIQHCIGYFPHKSCLLAMGQHCTGDFLVQSRPWQIQTAVHRQ